MHCLYRNFSKVIVPLFVSSIIILMLGGCKTDNDYSKKIYNKNKQSLQNIAEILNKNKCCTEITTYDPL